VWSYVRGMEAVGVKVFMDRRTLRSGQIWQKVIFDNIDSSEKLLLFWSHHARNSRWVERERRYGLEKKGIDFIRPVLLVDPNRVKPPPELGQALHFDDWNRNRTIRLVPTWLSYWIDGLFNRLGHLSGEDMPENRRRFFDS